MKKLGQRVVALLLVCCLCLGFGGCKALDEARANHAKWSETGSILLGDTEYMLIEHSENLYPTIDYLNSSVHVTESDVPVLLSFILGEFLYSSKDGMFLESADTGALYCRADRYGEIADKAQNGFEAVGYCFDYYTDDEGENYEEHTYRLSAEEISVLNAIMALGTAVEIPAVADVTYDYNVIVMQCDDSQLFRTYLADVCCVADTYYVLQQEGEKMTSIQVPDRYAPVFDKMLEGPRTQYENELEWYGDYEYEDYEDEEYEV